MFILIKQYKYLYYYIYNTGIITSTTYTVCTLYILGAIIYTLISYSRHESVYNVDKYAYIYIYIYIYKLTKI